MIADKINTWPTAWLEAAVTYGFAHYEGNGRFVFIDDNFRQKLEGFAIEIDKAARDLK